MDSVRKRQEAQDKKDTMMSERRKETEELRGPSPAAKTAATAEHRALVDYIMRGRFPPSLKKRTR